MHGPSPHAPGREEVEKMQASGPAGTAWGSHKEGGSRETQHGLCRKPPGGLEAAESHGGTSQGSFPLHPCASLHFASGLWCRAAWMEFPGRASCPLVSPHRAQQAPGTRVCMRLCEEAHTPPLSWDRHRAAAQPSHSPGPSTLLSSLSSLHPPAPCVAQDLFHHLEKSIYCQ